MLGVAKYLGFSKVVLLGCDYLGYPCLEGHFYSYDKNIIKGAYKTQYVNNIKQVVDNLEIDLLTIFPTGVKSKVFNSISFLDYFGIEEKYQEQPQIVNDDYLDLLKIASPKRQVFL